MSQYRGHEVWRGRVDEERRGRDGLLATDSAASNQLQGQGEDRGEPDIEGEEDSGTAKSDQNLAADGKQEGEEYSVDEHDICQSLLDALDKQANTEE